MSLADTYRNKCTELKIKPNSRLLRTLPAHANALTELDLEGNMIGSNGLLALLEVLRKCQGLGRLSLKGNMISSPPVEQLVAVLKEHASVRDVDLSGNDIRLAGPSLVDLVKSNARITRVVLEDTHLRPLFRNLIAMQLERNKKVDDVRPNTAPVKPTIDVNAPASPKSSLTAAASPARSSIRTGEEAAAEKKSVQFQTKDGAEAGSPRPNTAPAPDTSDADNASPKAADNTAPPVEAEKKQPPADAEEEKAKSTPNDDDGGFGDFGKFGTGADSEGEDDDDGGFGTFGNNDEDGGFGSGVGLTKNVSFAQGTTRDRPQAGPVRRPTVCAERITEENLENYVPPVCPKSAEEKAFLMQTLENLSLFCHLDDYELEQVVDAMQREVFDTDELVLSQGSEDADSFYVIFRGEVVRATEEEGDIQTCDRRDILCEVLLLYPQVAPETLRANADGTITFSLQRQPYKSIITKASKAKREKYEGFLQKIPFLSNMTKTELLQLADALKSSVYDPGQTLIKWGEEGDWLHIVCEGTVQVIGRDPDGNRVEVCTFTVGDCVGELEFINKHKCVADVVAKDKVRTAKMRRNHFEMCMGPVLDILKKNAESLEVYSYYRDTLARIREAA